MGGTVGVDLFHLAGMARLAGRLVPFPLQLNVHGLMGIHVAGQTTRQFKMGGTCVAVGTWRNQLAFCRPGRMIAPVAIQTGNPGMMLAVPILQLLEYFIMTFRTVFYGELSPPATGRSRCAGSNGKEQQGTGSQELAPGKIRELTHHSLVRTPIPAIIVH